MVQSIDGIKQSDENPSFREMATEIHNQVYK